MDITTLRGQPVCPLGLGAHLDMDPDAVRLAHVAGLNYFFFFDFSFKALWQGLKPLLAAGREDLVVATGCESRDPRAMREYLDQVRGELGLEEVDVFFADYVSPADDMEDVMVALDELHQWKARGLVRYVGVTVHDRPLALELIRSGRVEVLMHRYNMAHRGAEEEVLPAAQKAGIPVVAFTSTRWGTLLKGHLDWDGEAPRAADCYRYVLRHPAVRMTLTSPETTAQLQQNLAALKEPDRMDPAEQKRWEEYGALIYRDGRDDAFEAE